MFFCSSIAFVFVRVLKVVKSVNMPRRDYLRKVMPIGERRGRSLVMSLQRACSCALASVPA